MYIFNKKRFFSILIFPLLFNGLLFGMEAARRRDFADCAQERFLWRREQNAKLMLEKLSIKKEDYEILGYGAYSLVIKLKNNDNFVWKLTYSNIKNNENFGVQNEYFTPQKTATLLKNEKIDNVCKILEVINLNANSNSKQAYKGDFNQPYNLAIKMEYVNGVTLDKYINQREEKGNKYKISELYDLIISMCGVLSQFRNCGLIYSDIKEANIMVNQDGNFTIVDADSATTPKVTRKNSIEGATVGEQENMDLIKLVEMALKIVRGSKEKNQKNKFDLLNFGENNSKDIVDQLKTISGRVKQGKNKFEGPINTLDDFQLAIKTLQNELK